MREDRLSYFAKFSILLLVYFVTAKVGLGLDPVGGFAALVWPPTGVALAALLVLGFRFWPAIAAGAFLVNVATGASLPVALGIATGNTLEALLGAYLLTSFVKIRLSLERVKDVLGLIFFAAIFATTVSATIGVSSLVLGSIIAPTNYGETWLAWWVGDMLGAMVVAPLILVWSQRLRARIRPRRFFKASMPFGILIALSFLTFHGLPAFNVEPFAFAYVVFPILVWIVLQFDQRGSVTATFIVSTIAVWGTVATHELTNGTELSQSLLLLQSFIAITAATFMTMAAIVSEREETQKRQQLLQQKTVLLTKQREKLKALNKAKDEFISIASHQLRTPATGVKQYLGMLLEAYAGTLTKQQFSHVETAYENNERQIKIINDLLRVARLDAGKLHLVKNSCDLTRLVSEIAEQQSVEFEKRNQKLVFIPEKKHVKAPADKELLRMVIENILDNAGKYSASGGKIHISITQTDRHVQLQITDLGIGIARKDQKKLFQKFSRIENTHSNFINGTGLGLYWAKKVIDLHGGTISLTSELNKGSTFTVSLPRE